MAFRYRPPADVDDFEAGQDAARSDFQAAWHEYMAGEMLALAHGGRFFAPHSTTDPTAGTVQQVPWNGFPQSLTRWFNATAEPAGRLRAMEAAERLAPIAIGEADDDGYGRLTFRRRQDEYCEWFVDRDADGGITRISFTAEPPEYWQLLARDNLALVGNLYRRYVDRSVRDEELVFPVAVEYVDLITGEIRRFEAGEYDPLNVWNTARGAMHLTHSANTLGAEVKLAADGTVLYPSVAEQPADSLPERLICCAGYGGVNRSSDPAIGAGVNQAVREGLCVSLADPVGLYISEVQLRGFRRPDGKPIGSEALSVMRKSADGTRVLRAEVRVPPGADYTLDQCSLDGQLLRYGGQIAEKITMGLYALARTIPDVQADTSTCMRSCCRRPGTNYVDPVDVDADCAQHDFERRAPTSSADVDVATARTRHGQRIRLPRGAVAVTPVAPKPSRSEPIPVWTG